MRPSLKVPRRGQAASGLDSTWGAFYGREGGQWAGLPQSILQAQGPLGVVKMQEPSGQKEG